MKPAGKILDANALRALADICERDAVRVDSLHHVDDLDEAPAGITATWFAELTKSGDRKVAAQGEAWWGYYLDPAGQWKERP